MATTGAKFPASNITASEAPWDDTGWVNPSNIYSDNAAYASCYKAGAYSSAVLKAYNFDFSVIPDDATIDGVICKLNAWKGSASDANLGLLQLLNVSRVKGGTNHCLVVVALTTDDTTIITEGGAADLWGNVLTPLWVKDPDFGVALGMISSDSGACRVDYVTLEVYYTELTLDKGGFFVFF